MASIRSLITFSEVLNRPHKNAQLLLNQIISLLLVLQFNTDGSNKGAADFDEPGFLERTESPKRNREKLKSI